jgi:hypothetical protein
MTDIVFANTDHPVEPDKAIIHDDETFQVQWSALNISDQDVPAFVDRLVITSIPEGCPGSDDVKHEVVFQTDIDEPELASGAAGELMNPLVGPFPAGSYRLTVTLANNNGSGLTTFNCIEIEAAN